MEAETPNSSLPGSIPVKIDQIEAAANRIEGRVHRTPLTRSQTLSRLTKCSLWLKPENFQKTGSFKVRGALNAIDLLDDDASRHGVSTFSAGNHGQALAFAAASNEISCTVYMASNASPAKISAIREYGADVEQYPDIHDAFEAMESAAREGRTTIVMPFSEPEVIAGQGTVGLEIAADLDEINTVVVPVGGGGLISGVSIAIKALSPATRVVGVCAAAMPAVARALEAGTPVSIPSQETIADGLAAPFTTELNLEIVRTFVDDLVTVTEDEIRSALITLLERTKILVEPAGAAAVAALMTGKAAVPTGAETVAILSGGNIDTQRLKHLL